MVQQKGATENALFQEERLGKIIALLEKEGRVVTKDLVICQKE